MGNRTMNLQIRSLTSKKIRHFNNSVTEDATRRCVCVCVCVEGGGWVRREGKVTLSEAVQYFHLCPLSVTEHWVNNWPPATAMRLGIVMGASVKEISFL